MTSLAGLLLTVFGFAASAADIPGTWKRTAETPNGTIKRTFTFRSDGTKLTGESTREIFEKCIISDGKIEGDVVSFTLTVKFQDDEMKVNYKGKIEGDELVLRDGTPGREFIRLQGEKSLFAARFATYLTAHASTRRGIT